MLTWKATASEPSASGRSCFEKFGVVFFGEGKPLEMLLVPSISINFPWSLALLGDGMMPRYMKLRRLLSSCFIYPCNSSINRKHMGSLLGPTSVCEFQRVSFPQFPFRQGNYNSATCSLLPPLPSLRKKPHHFIMPKKNNNNETFNVGVSLRSAQVPKISRPLAAIHPFFFPGCKLGIRPLGRFCGSPSSESFMVPGVFFLFAHIRAMA